MSWRIRWRISCVLEAEPEAEPETEPETEAEPVIALGLGARGLGLGGEDEEGEAAERGLAAAGDLRGLPEPVAWSWPGANGGIGPEPEPEPGSAPTAVVTLLKAPRNWRGDEGTTGRLTSRAGSTGWKLALLKLGLTMGGGGTW